jgi:signal transduction histidine kinase
MKNLIREFLEKVSLFSNLTETDLKHICDMVQEVRLTAGEELFAEGSPGDRAYVIQEGQLEVLKFSSGREVLLDVPETGAVIGEMALLQEVPRMASVRARTDCVLLALHHDPFTHLLHTSPSASHAMLHTVLTRWRNTQAMLRQSERMAQLGTLTAGVAHELNNPAAAVKRGADHLLDAIELFASAQGQIRACAFSDAQQERLHELSQHAKKEAAQPTELDALASSDREYELEVWLEEQGVAEAWDYAPTLVKLDYDPAKAKALSQEFGPDQLPAVISWLDATYQVNSLLNEIGQGAGRISEIVKALKSYSYLDQAPVQAVDIHDGLDNTLVILRSKLKAGIQVRRQYAPDLPKIEAYGSQLNQVWTNLLDNAADALDGQGQITIRTSHDAEWVVVEIEDDGPGIPLEIQPKIFDPFFTTKAPGQGTGLGLDISYNIVVQRHRGDIKLKSQPGQTCFEVWLPVNSEAE